MRYGIASSTIEFETPLTRDFAGLRSGLRVLQWQLGLLIAITLSTLLLVLRLPVKLGALLF
jgi:hypothetical protein